jgi:hypothetical protein
MTSLPSIAVTKSTVGSAAGSVVLDMAKGRLFFLGTFFLRIRAPVRESLSFDAFQRRISSIRIRETELDAMIPFEIKLDHEDGDADPA